MENLICLHFGGILLYVSLWILWNWFSFFIFLQKGILKSYQYCLMIVWHPNHLQMMVWFVSIAFSLWMVFSLFYFLFDSLKCLYNSFWMTCYGIAVLIVCTDWEAIADREPSELLSSECLPGVSNLSLEDSKVEAPKRRGRGTFSYRKTELYSDRLSDVSASKDTDNEDVCKHPETKTMECKPLCLTIQSFFFFFFHKCSVYV